MDKYRIGLMLREKEGINGLKIIKRVPSRPQDKTNKPLIPEPVKEAEKLRYNTVSGLMQQPVKTGIDLRNFNGSGQATEDYCITGEGRPSIVIREVQNTVPGIKKYALIDLPEDKKPKFMSRKKREQEAKKPVIYPVRYAYSEGIDIEKMAEDEEYANAVIGLLQETRLKKKEEQSRSMGTDVVYLGTITKGENGYVMSGITDYIAAMATIARIDAAVKQGEEEATKKYRDLAREEKKEKEHEEVDETLDTYSDDQVKYTFYMAGRKLGIPIEELEKLVEQSHIKAKAEGNPADEKEEQSVWDEPLN